jgi:acetyl-CoA acetyltransferase
MVDFGEIGVTKESQIAIVGVDESDEIGVVPHKSTMQLLAEAARNALIDAGLTLKDVDGVFTADLSARDVAEYLQIRPSFMDGTSVGGSSFVMQLGHAAIALRMGLCNVALITHGESGRSGIGMPRISSGPQSAMAQFEDPFGIPNPYGCYAMACTRHMHMYGTTREQLAEIAVATRKWAAMNPKALRREPITIEDVLTAREIAYPFGKLDCCLVTDAGGAVVLTRMDRARDCRREPIAVLGHGEATDHSIISQMPDLAAGPATMSGARAFAMAGIKPSDIDVAQIYDSFTYTVLLSLEDLGFCARGEGGAFVSGQRTAPGGQFALNTSGGGLSYTHPGMFGVFTIIEAVRQLRQDYAGQGLRQVERAHLALVHGTGGVLSTAGTAILGRVQ